MVEGLDYHEGMRVEGKYHKGIIISALAFRQAVKEKRLNDPKHATQLLILRLSRLPPSCKTTD